MRQAGEKPRSVRANVKISGMVQGVFFRAYTREKAVQMGVTGWVRNLRDGRVGGLFEGNQRAVSELISWCRKGPPSARVKDVDVEWGEYSGEFDTFFVARSAGWDY
jgi:acylphosphatase